MVEYISGKWLKFGKESYALAMYIFCMLKNSQTSYASNLK